MVTQKEAKIFVKHIQKHINDEDITPLILEPQCKICGLYLSEIIEKHKGWNEKWNII